MLEWGTFEDFAVGETIERDASGEAERLLARLSRKARPIGGQHFFQCGLHAGSEIVMTLGERFLRFARWAETLFQIVRKEATHYGSAVRIAPGHLGALRLVDKIFQAK